jgi:hypothetical protein
MSRRVFQGFQRICHDAKGSGEAEKQFLKHDVACFQNCSLKKSIFERVLETHPENIETRSCEHKSSHTLKIGRD